MDFKTKKEAVIQSLISQGYLKTEKIIKAFREVPREDFVPENYKNYAYVDEPMPIGQGQTISAMHMVAIMTELLEPKKTDKILEVGCGSGYQAAILSRLVKKIYTIELEPELAEFARNNLKRLGYNNVEIIVGDGSRGFSKEKPYGKIIVTCAVREIPKPLIEQLKNNGRIVVPVGGEWYQELILGIKKDKKLIKENHGGCVFVPLRH